MLSNIDIESLMAGGSLCIVSEKKIIVRPASVCLHLACELLAFQASSKSVDPLNSDTYPQLIRKKICDIEGYVLHPNEFVLAGTIEKIGLDESIGGMLSNLSGLARLGLNVLLSTHVAPGFGKKEPRGLTLEVHNVAPFPIVLRGGMRICHIVFHKLYTNASVSYDDLMAGKYKVAPSGSEYLG